MAQQCATIPTSTQFNTVTTDSTSTSFSLSVTTLPPQVSTITGTVCITSTINDTATTTVCRHPLQVTTLPASVSTSTVDVFITVPVVNTVPTATLFSTSCSDTPPPPPPPSNVTTPDPITTPPTTTPSSTSSSTSIFNASSTLPDGSVTMVQQTSVFVVTASATPQSNSSNGGSKTNVGAIAGGVAGGLALLVAIGLLLWYLLGKKSNSDYEPGLTEDYDHSRYQKHSRGPLDDEVPEEPRNEYHYGALGHSTSPTGFGATSGAPPSMWDPGYGAGHGSGGIGGQGPGGGNSTVTYGDGGASGYGGGASSGAPPSTLSGTPSAGPMNGTGPTSYPNIPASQPYPTQTTVPAFIPPPFLPGMIPQSRRSESTRESEDTAYHHSNVPLTVANPDESYVPYQDPRDIKNPQLYLSAESGYEMRGGSASPSGSSAQSRPVVQHQDGGSISTAASSTRPLVAHAGSSGYVASSSSEAAASASASGSSSNPRGELRRRRSTDKTQPLGPQRGEGDDGPAPPAYEA